MPIVPTPHPILRVPTPAQAAEMGYEAFCRLLAQRDEAIANEKADPLRYGYEPPVWRLADALLEWPWLDAAWCAEVRARVGFKRRVQMLLINGGNRGGKSEYAAKRVQMLLHHRAGARAWCFQSSDMNSVEYQQPLLWKYLPKEARRNVKSTTEYIAYTQKNGFSDNRFVLANGSECTFRNYMQEVTLIEGGEADVIWPDELLPTTWLKTLKARIATRDGWLVLTFTPVEGYSPTVGLFQDGAEAVLDETAFLVPRDQGDPRPDLAFPEEQPGYVQPRRLEDMLDRREPAAAGRHFDRVPRVLRCVEDNKAVVFFHTGDNPYGNPRNVWQLYKGDGAPKIKERLYGVATKLMANRFPRFRPAAHVVPASAIPVKGTNYHFVDPASGRNFFMIWARFTPEGIYVFEEWPGGFEIPGVGVPGPWTVPSDHRMDGDRGPAQSPFGFGLKRYKEEIARLEGWRDWRERADSKRPVEEWDEARGADIVVDRRFLDSRAASAPRQENDRPVTLQTDFDRLRLYFDLAPGDDIDEGVVKINDLLDYDADSDLSYFNKPRLYIADRCRNVIYALQNWTGADGQRGACKDCIDVLRYMVLSGVEYIGEGAYRTQGGGCY